MNKRQRKKSSKKVIYPIVDEMNLLTLDKEEYAKAMEEFDAFVQRHYRYKHYKDRSKMIKRFCLYQFPVGKSVKEFYERIFRTVRKYNYPPTMVIQDIETLKSQYQEEWSHLFDKETC